jgi:TrmH family RNA methyltransferase
MRLGVAMWSVQGAKIQILLHRNIFFIFAFTEFEKMISTAQTKLIRSLRQKKFREYHNLFMVEGEKMVLELAESNPGSRFQIKELYATAEWIERHAALLQARRMTYYEATPREISRVSNLVTPQAVIALVTIPGERFNAEELVNTPVLAFESIRDPGNLGTIIRTADWFGIRQIVCTPDSTELFNPKVVQSTMGAITRVQVHYLEIETLLKNREMKTKAVLGTFLDGENIYETPLEPDPFILFGNESHGLSNRFDPYIQRKISIPSFSHEVKGSESLNVASSVAVICSELRRR